MTLALLISIGGKLVVEQYVRLFGGGKLAPSLGRDIHLYEDYFALLSF